MEIILIILSGILYVIPFIMPNLYFISWFAFIPFLYAVHGKNKKHTFYKGWLLGFIIMIGVGYPLYFPIKSFTNFPNFLVTILIIIIFVILSLIYGGWAKLYETIKTKDNFNPLLFSFSWFVLEIVRHIILNFFPLGYLGYSQANFNHIIQIADIGGVFLVSFLIVLVNALIFKFIVSKNIRYIIIPIIIFGLVISYGYFQINNYDDIQQSIKVGVIQTNIIQSEKWLTANIEKHNELFINENSKFKEVDLVITPESALTFDINKDVEYREEILNKIDQIDKYYQIGILATKDKGYEFYNSSYLINPDGKIEGRYDKNKLVLFGEKIIFSNLIEKITGYKIHTLIAGDEIKIFNSPFANWKTVICSEILYPEFVARNISETDFIINQSNEAWFNNSKALKNHMFASLVFRAVENRRSIVKVGNLTYSGVVYPSGKRMKISGDNTLIINSKIIRNNSLYNRIVKIFINIS
jgi:apolipoprotein N-acyltransferase